MAKNTNNILNETLITGANGMVGSYVDFGIKTDRDALDITDLSNVISVCKKYKPKVIIHLAAETDVTLCEKDSKHAYFVNSVGTYNMCLGAKEVGAKLIYVSTSAVFNGLKKDSYVETDKPDPQNYYGRSKFLGEVIVSSILSDYIIARVAWMFGGGAKKDQKFVAKIITQTTNDEIKVVSGMKGSPTFGKDLVGALKKLILANKKGIFHLSNTGSPSRFDIVSEIVKITGSKAKVSKVPSNFFGGALKKENNESMSSKIKIMRPWKEALKEYIQEEWKEYIK